MHNTFIVRKARRNEPAIEAYDNMFCLNTVMTMPVVSHQTSLSKYRLM